MGQALIPLPHERLLPFRAVQSQLGERLAAGSWREAAWGGLQDSSPRAALLSLHARMEGVAPDTWADPELWQIWLRMSDYVVPRRDFGVFTLGALPRNPRLSGPLLATARTVTEIVGGRTVGADEVGAALAGRKELDERTRRHGAWVIREACVTGRYRIHWDTRTVTVTATPGPDLDPEDARRELVRRFLHWHGPATARQFATWAHVPLTDAVETWRRLGPALLPMSVDGDTRHALAEDEPALRHPPPVRGVRLVPFSDPIFALDRKLLAAVPPGPGARLTGRILVDGAAVGTWARREHRLSIWLWGRPEASVRERVRSEAQTLAGPLGRPVEIRELG